MGETTQNCKTGKIAKLSVDREREIEIYKRRSSLNVSTQISVISTVPCEVSNGVINATLKMRKLDSERLGSMPMII